MSLKSTIIKTLIKLTPNFMVVWVSNIIMKGIAELINFNFDIDNRTIYAQTRLYGEDDTIEVWLEDFSVFYDQEQDCYRFILHHARSDRAWLNNLLAKFIGKGWKIPALPQFSKQLELVAELFKEKSPGLPSE